jgi:hypothetical protein
MVFTESIFTSSCSTISTADVTTSLTYVPGTYLIYSTTDYLSATSVFTFLMDTAVTITLTSYAEVTVTNGACIQTITP